MIREKWEAWGNHVPLQVIESPYRSVVRPFLDYLDAVDAQVQGRTLMVVLPELVFSRWWHQFLHNQTALRLKAALLFRPGTVVVIENDHNIADLVDMYLRQEGVPGHPGG